MSKVKVQDLISKADVLLEALPYLLLGPIEAVPLAVDDQSPALSVTPWLTVSPARSPFVILTVAVSVILCLPRSSLNVSEIVASLPV